MQRKLLLSLLVLTLGCSAAVYGADKADKPRDGQKRAQGDREHRRGWPGGHERRGFLRHAIGQLDLTDDQKTAIRELAQAHHEKVKAYREAHKDEFEAIRGKLKQARKDKDREAGKAAMEQLHALRQNGPSPMQLVDQIKGQLTDAQAGKLDQMFAAARERMEKRRAERGQRGDGDRKRSKRDKD